MTTIAPAESLKNKCIRQWQTLLSHKFIMEMENDSLPLEKFVFYLKQDHIFLKEFCNFLLNAKQKAAFKEEDNPKLVEWFDSLYHSTVDLEMQMQRELLLSAQVAVGGSTPVFKSDGTVNASPTISTSNYISFLRKMSSSTGNSSLEEIVSAMAPCPWSYLEIAQKLSGNIDNNIIKTEIYLKWIQFYASKESQKQVEELKFILGNLYCNASKPLKLLMQNHFEAACKHEYSFWEMAYNHRGRGLT